MLGMLVTSQFERSPAALLKKHNNKNKNKAKIKAKTKTKSINKSVQKQKQRQNKYQTKSMSVIHVGNACTIPIGEVIRCTIEKT